MHALFLILLEQEVNTKSKKKPMAKGYKNEKKLTFLAINKLIQTHFEGKNRSVLSVNMIFTYSSPTV